MRRLREHRGAGLRLLTETIVSPTLAWQIKELFKAMPEAKWHVWEPLHHDAACARRNKPRSANRSTPFTTSARPTLCSRWMPTFCNVVRANLAYAADFMARRRVRTTEKDAGQAQMNRLYMAETAVSCTGAKADHRLALRPSEIEKLARAIAAQCGIETAGMAPTAWNEKWIAAVAKDLQTHRGRSLVLVGDSQPAAVHLLAHALNERLGNVGADGPLHRADRRPADRADPIAARADQRHRTKAGRNAGSAGRQPGVHRAGRFRLRRPCFTRCRFASATAFTLTRPRIIAIGTCPRPITWNRGAIREVTTARRRSCSR